MREMQYVATRYLHIELSLGNRVLKTRPKLLHDIQMSSKNDEFSPAR